MDFIEENMTAQEMLEKIAQLDHSKSVLKDQNTEMRSWLDAADEDIASLRSENSSLKKQVKELEKVISDAHIVESEPTNSQPDYLDLEIRNEVKIQKLEKESVCLKEENKKLTAEIRELQHLQDQDDVSLNKLKVSLQILESEMEVAQLGLQQRDEVIEQKHQELKHAEEMVEEYSTIIKDLRLKNQQLKDTLEAGQDEVSFAIAIDLLEAKEKSTSPVLSFADELRLLDSSAHNNISLHDVTQSHAEAVSENIQKTHCSVVCKDTGSMDKEASSGICASTFTSCSVGVLQAFPIVKTNPQESSKHYKCIGLLLKVTEKVVLFLGALFLFFVLAAIASGSFTGNSELLSYDTIWSGVRFLLEPYCTLHYGGLPPI